MERRALDDRNGGMGDIALDFRWGLEPESGARDCE